MRFNCNEAAAGEEQNRSVTTGPPDVVCASMNFPRFVFAIALASGFQIEPRKIADIIAIPGDPTADSSATERVSFVTKNDNP